jgi:hypothetical protein
MSEQHILIRLPLRTIKIAADSLVDFTNQGFYDYAGDRNITLSRLTLTRLNVGKDFYIIRTDMIDSFLNLEKEIATKKLPICLKELDSCNHCKFQSVIITSQHLGYNQRLLRWSSVIDYYVSHAELYFITHAIQFVVPLKNIPNSMLFLFCIDSLLSHLNKALIPKNYFPLSGKQP